MPWTIRRPNFRRPSLFPTILLSGAIAIVSAAALQAQQPTNPPSDAAKAAADKAKADRDKALQAVGFTARSQSGAGEFITEEQIAQQHPAQATDLFTRVRGVRVDYASGYPMLTDARQQAGGCMSYIVDGVLRPMQDPADFNNFMHPGDIAAIEVYTPQQTPNVFRADNSANCEVIVIWTKDKIGS